MTLWNAEEGKEYSVIGINTDDGEIKAFLFSLGCYAGEQISIISKHKSSMTVSVKDARYNIDRELCESIEIYE